MRIRVFWSEYQTGPNQYDQGVVNRIVSQVQAARGWSPYAFDPKALVEFELPNEIVPWMQQAGYSLTQGEGQGASRYYPASIAGAEAYGRAMAKLLKTLYDVQIAHAIETPNEPNLINATAQAVPAEHVGRLGAFGLTYAAAEGVPVTSPGGPVVLVGAVNTDPNSAHGSEGTSPAQYFDVVQTSANYWLEWWWKGLPNGVGHAEWLMGFWRASFHSYPKLGVGEGFSCQRMETPQGAKLQDEAGDLTGQAAYNEVAQRLAPVLSVLTGPKGKGRKWWITETGMTSYKTNVVNETYQACINRRVAGGSAYGKAEQRNFYSSLAFNVDWNRLYGSYPWNSVEGVAFFMPNDFPMAPNDPFKGFGAFMPGCGNYCWKPAAEYFANNL